MASAKVSDVIDEILEDHRELEEYYGKFKAAQSVDEAHKYFHQFVWENSRHAVSEEIVVYPMMEAVGERGKKLVEESLEGHRRLKTMLHELENEKDEAKFGALFDATYKELQDHLKIEEGEDLPFIKENISLEERQKAAKRFTLGKKLAPTRPHPGIPDKPVALQMALGLLITPIDKLRDAFTEFPDKE